MFTKLEQRFWTKIEVARGRSIQECGDAALHYGRVALWVNMFREGRDAVQDNLRTGRSHVEYNTGQLLASLLDADRRWTTRELAAEVRVCHKTVLHILSNRKLALCWIPREIPYIQ